MRLKISLRCWRTDSHPRFDDCGCGTVPRAFLTSVRVNRPVRFPNFGSAHKEEFDDKF